MEPDEARCAMLSIPDQWKAVGNLVKYGETRRASKGETQDTQSDFSLIALELYHSWKTCYGIAIEFSKRCIFSFGIQ